MQPIVHELRIRYSRCLTLETVNYHEDTPERAALHPFGSPEFFLLDSKQTVLYRWFGRTDAEEFDAIIAPLC